MCLPTYLHAAVEEVLVHDGAQYLGLGLPNCCRGRGGRCSPAATSSSLLPYLLLLPGRRSSISFHWLRSCLARCGRC